MFAVNSRKQMRISSLPMRRKDKERIIMERRSQRNNFNNKVTSNMENDLGEKMEREILYIQQNINKHKQELYKLENALKDKTEAYKSLLNSKKLKENMIKEQKAKEDILNEVKGEVLSSYKVSTNTIEERNELKPVSIKEEEEEEEVVEEEVVEEEVVEEEVVEEEVVEEKVVEEEVVEEKVVEEEEQKVTIAIEELTLEQHIEQLDEKKSKRGRKKKQTT